MNAPAAAPLLSVRGLSKHFPARASAPAPGPTRAVNDVSFDLAPGETLGLVGESGSGKTTTARCILRALAPTAGQVLFRQRDGAVVDLAALPERALQPLRPQMQMIFQDPFSSLNPRLTVAQIVGEPLDIHRLGSPREREERVVDILRKVGLQPEHRTQYPNAFSGGQRQRIGIARALIMRPALVVADEAVSSLDVSVQAQVLNLLKDLQEEFRLTYLFVAHNLDVVRNFCDRVAVMYAGRIVELAPAAGLFDGPLHPYTQALLSAVPPPDPDVKMKFDLPGEIADPTRLPEGCAFHPRCPECFAPCKRLLPELRTTATTDELGCVYASRAVACHLRDPAHRPGHA
ncbi:MAG: ABC transporter ATP-binding protein [Opitutae bacterium]|nr:ABC transporter ATP-binding protein [Opitutae bacterium]